MLKLLTILLALAPIPAFAADACESKDNWSAIQDCAFQSQMDHLDKVYNDTLTLVRRDNPEAAELLKKAQAAWRDFADKSCEFTVASRLPDSNDLRLGCWQEFIAAREKTLLSYKRDHGKEPYDLMHP